MTEINSMSFGSTIDMLSNALKGADLNQQQIANNIANVNTPGYRRSTVSFKEALAEAVQGVPSDPSQLAMTTDNDRQFAIGAAQPVQPFDPKAQMDATTQMRADQSNIDIDQESAQLAENSSYSQSMAQLLQTQFGIYHSVITEQPR